MHVCHFGCICRRSVKRQRFNLIVFDWNIKAVSKLENRLFIEFFELVGWIFRLASTTHTIALHCFGKNNGGLMLMIDSAIKGGIYLVGIMPAPIQTPYVVIGHLGHHFEQTGMLAKKVLSNERAIICFKRLVLAVDRLFHHALQNPLAINSKQRVPIRAPN